MPVEGRPSFFTALRSFLRQARSAGEGLLPGGTRVQTSDPPPL
jgi:hypothetical protein